MFARMAPLYSKVGRLHFIVSTPPRTGLVDQFADVHQDRLCERLGFCDVVINAVIEGVGLAHVPFLKSLEKQCIRILRACFQKNPALYKGTTFILAKRAGSDRDLSSTFPAHRTFHPSIASRAPKPQSLSFVPRFAVYWRFGKPGLVCTDASQRVQAAVKHTRIWS